MDNRSLRTLAPLLLAIASGAVVMAQAPSDVKDGKVAVIGENPGIRLNGTHAAGSVTPRMRGSRQSSSAFLAFAETWLR